MRVLDLVKVALVVLFAVLAQVSILSAYSPLGGSFNLVMVTLLTIALLRGPLYGSAAGFLAGFLVDAATVGTLGFTSLLLTIAGYWIGRYGETTAENRYHAPFLSVAVVTLTYAFAAAALRFILGQTVSLGVVVAALPATLLLNLLLVVPVYAVIRRLFPPIDLSDRVQEVRLLG